MREIIFDSETTGLSPDKGDRIIELGAIEVIDKVKTGRFFHKFINPERDVPAAAFRVHGISTEFLQDKPKFLDVAQEFLEFIGQDKLVIHNAAFDMKFVNHELSILGIEKIERERAIDTLALARRKFPGAPASLDALCKRFCVSTQDRRDKGHGALLDSELLYQVYVCLTEGVQSELVLRQAKDLSNSGGNLNASKETIEARSFAHESDLGPHKEFLKKIPNNIWEK